MASLDRKIWYVSRLQLVFLSVTWLAGIYVNGFVSILPGTGTEAILLDPPVGFHVILATLSAATSVFLLGLAWALGSKRVVMVMALLASFSIVIAGDSGLAFVLGGGSDSGESMIMATAFITAVFLTFLSMASLGAGDRPSTTAVERMTGRAPLVLFYSALVLFYAIFVTGIYVNLFVAGPDFSLPPNSQAAAFVRSESSAAFVLHEAVGGLLLSALVLVAGSLWYAGARRLSMVSAVPALLVAYSAYVGSLNFTSLAVRTTSVLVPMLSSAGLMVALILTMLLTLRVRAGKSFG